MGKRPAKFYAGHIILMGTMIKNIDSEEDTHVELAVLDSARRIQVPEDYLEAIGIDDSNKVRMELEDDRIVIVNPNEKVGKIAQ